MTTAPASTPEPIGLAESLTLVGASAGSGKTYRLTEVVTSAVHPGSTSPVDVEGLVAVTYTRRAAGELAARIRRTLVQAGEIESSQRLPLAYLGTVHAVCLRLVQEFAIDAGLSPEVGVLPGGESRLLRQALETGLEPELHERIDALAHSLQIRLDPRLERVDWLTPVEDIMTLARSNRIPGSELPAMAERSARRLLELMGPPERDAAALDFALARALLDADRRLGTIRDGVQKTEKVRETIEKAIASVRRGTLAWSDWLRLQKLDPGRAARDAVSGVIDVASRVDRHPRLHQEIEQYVECAYAAARQGLSAYESWKSRRRVVDFVDMVDRALTLVEHPAVAEELGRRLELLVVDELQDTSPIQLALFTRLHRLCGRSVWVGDRKQCIFEYAGADPALMDAVATWVASAGGATERLPKNRRSRPELVDACSRLFAAAFARHGCPPQEVVVEPARPSVPELESLPPLGLWWLTVANQSEESSALAEGVRRLLASSGATPVVDRATHAVRAARAADVAVLVATNDEAERLAVALAGRGIRSRIARTGLLSTPEGVLVTAALRVLADPRDTLAAATLQALCELDGKSPDAWLDALIDAYAARHGGAGSGGTSDAAASPPPPNGRAARLLGLRDEVHALAPCEALDRVLAVLEVAAIAARWPDPPQRLGNLDALRALAASYEERCAHHAEAATIAGLLRFFGEAAEKVLIRDEERAADHQHVGTGDAAVTIVTYHKAKGLEWPVVVLGSLNRGERRTVFEVSPETDQPFFDPVRPLEGRWIRYWPWPYGPQKKSPLSDAADASPEGLLVARREEAERVRLLYVGFTRARDHLILAARVNAKGPQVAWLDGLCDEEGKPLFELPRELSDDEVADVAVRELGGATFTVRARHWSLGVGSNPPERLPSAESHGWFALPASIPAPARPGPAYWISPSKAAAQWADVPRPAVAEVESLGRRLPLADATGVEWDTVGNALHAFLAADVPGLSAEQRLARATRLLGGAGLLSLLRPEALLQAGDDLRRWIERRWPGATWHREVSVRGVVATPEGARRVEGTIDLLLEAGDGLVVIDHKSYPGSAAQCREKAAELAPQLGAYAEVLKGTGKPVLELWLSFAVAGVAVRLSGSDRRQMA